MNLHSPYPQIIHNNYDCESKYPALENKTQHETSNETNTSFINLCYTFK